MCSSAVLVAAVLALLVLSSAPASARQSGAIGPWDIGSIFFISKSHNKNQVHYGLRLQADCTPSGPAPVFAYWKMLEEGPGQTSPLLDREQAAYGVSEEQRIFRTAGEPRVKFHVRAFPDRPIVARPRLRGGRCVAEVVCDIRGESALLHQIHVVLGVLWTVRSVTLEGQRIDRAAPTFEIIR